MTSSLYIEVTTRELCEEMHLSRQTLIELVEYGIVEPQGGDPDSWRFDPHWVCVTRRAVRLHRDLGIDWPGVAVIVDLIAQRERLRHENNQLRQRLQRFTLG